MKNEKTGKKSGSAAASLMRYAQKVPPTHIVVAIPDSVRIALMSLLNNSKDKVYYLSRVSQLKAVVASALTQRPDKKEKK